MVAVSPSTRPSVFLSSVKLSLPTTPPPPKRNQWERKTRLGTMRDGVDKTELSPNVGLWLYLARFIVEDYGGLSSDLEELREKKTFIPPAGVPFILQKRGRVMGRRGETY